MYKREIDEKKCIYCGLIFICRDGIYFFFIFTLKVSGVVFHG